MDLFIAESSTISGPRKLTSYYVVAPFNDPKTRFNLMLGSTVQVMQKEPSGEFDGWVGPLAGVMGRGDHW